MNHELQASRIRITSILALLALLVATAAVAAPLRAQPRQVIPSASGPTVVAQDISSNATWELAKSPYLVTIPVKVLASAILTIEPGVEVQFLQDTGLQIEGGLNAQGRHAQPITFTGNGAAIQWQGLGVVQPAANVVLRDVTITQARAGVAIQPSAIAIAATTRVDILESLFDTNVIGVSADYSGAAGAPHLTLRNNLLTNNSVAVEIDSLPSGSNLIKLSSNSFVLNGIGIKALNVAEPGPKAERQWWGSAAGPTIGDATYCGNDPPPNPGSTPPDIVCGPVDFSPWSTVPAGRIILQPDKEGAITSTIGGSTLSDDLIAATSAVTVTIPAQSFGQAVDLVLAPRDETAPLPGQPTMLGFEISAVANGLELYQLAAAKKITVQIDYVIPDLAGADAQKLTLYAFDPSVNHWNYFDITAIPDPPSRRIFAQLDRLSRLRLSAVDFATTWLALIQT